MLDMRARKNVSRAVDPVARLVARIGVTPTMVTLSGLALSLAGSILIGFGHLTVGAAILGGGAILDILDGVLARVTGRGVK
jgi:CDP-diacylglycerol--glycerol-3-phosphate 3-phosphatidyltransferase